MNGPILVEKANSFAIIFGLPPTCNLNYISRWRKRNNILWHGKIHDESASVDPVGANDWLSKLEGLCSDFKDENIFNTDETLLSHASKWYYEVQT